MNEIPHLKFIRIGKVSFNGVDDLHHFFKG